MFVEGWIRRVRGVVGVLLGGALAGVLVAWMTGQGVVWPEWQTDLLGTLLLTLSALLVAETRGIRFSLCIGVLGWFLVQVCGEVTGTGYVLSTWLLLNVALFADRRRDLDFRLHLRDRLRAHRILSASAVPSAGSRQGRG